MTQWPPQSRFYQFQDCHLLAIDFGLKRTGLAQFIPGRDPFPLLKGTLTTQKSSQLIEKIEEVLIQEEIDAIVLGVPYLTDGTSTQMTRRVLNFHEKLCKRLKIPVFTQDETLSTFEAQERMKLDPRFHFRVDTTKKDELAAALILEDFLKSPQ